MQSYKRAAAAAAAGRFGAEVVPMEVVQSKGGVATVVSEDEDVKKVNFDKLPTLKPAFLKDGTVTAANSSKLNDGATALLLMAGEEAQRRGLKPLARIIGRPPMPPSLLFLDRIC